MESQIDTVQNLINMVITYSVKYGFQVLGALVILVAGFYLSRWAGGLVLVFCEQRRLDITLAKFFAGVTRITLMAFVLIIALGNFGITVAPFIAALGAVAFGGSLAIQGPLSNYGAGLSIILTRPFVVGNTIKVQGVSGIVEEIRLAATILRTEDGEVITIPNRQVVGQIIQNSFERRIIETTVGIAYEDDPKQAIAVIRDALAGFDEVTKDPPPQVGIDRFGDFAIELGLRYWVPTGKYFPVKFATNQAVFAALKRAGITIPYPKREVRVVQQAAA